MSLFEAACLCEETFLMLKYNNKYNLRPYYVRFTALSNRQGRFVTSGMWCCVLLEDRYQCLEGAPSPSSRYGLKLEAAGSSKTMITLYLTACCHILKDSRFCICIGITLLTLLFHGNQQSQAVFSKEEKHFKHKYKIQLLLISSAVSKHLFPHTAYKFCLYPNVSFQSHSSIETSMSTSSIPTQGSRTILLVIMSFLESTTALELQRIWPIKIVILSVLFKDTVNC